MVVCSKVVIKSTTKLFTLLVTIPKQYDVEYLIPFTKSSKVFASEIKVIEMFLSLRALDPKMKIIEDEFGKPVEKIMGCGDFKSNFARRLSNRHIVPLDADTKSDSEHSSKLSLINNKLESMKENVVDIEITNEACRENRALKGEDASDGGCESSKQVESEPQSRDIHRTEVAALNTQVDTLRWQLKQTEANRQMHIALLEQVVTFLHKVKEHMGVRQTNGHLAPTRAAANSDMLRSRSVFHVNNTEYTHSPVKKMTSRKMSKSISNVNGYHKVDLSKHEAAAQDFAWRQSKLSLLEETNSHRKIFEELSRLISLADTVLTTKIPHLSGCGVQEPNLTEPPKKSDLPEDVHAKEEINTDELFKSAFILNTSNESHDFDGITNKYIEERNRRDNYTIPPSPLTCGLEDDFASVSLHLKCDSFTTSLSEKKVKKEKKDSPVGIEDESGFSSMSSFQEIGIPIINVIPPTPSKEKSFVTEEENSIAGEETWKTELDLDKQSMKVFWV